MKTCPSCHQTYPADGPDFCTNDGTRLVSSESSYPNPGRQWQASGGQPQPPPLAGWQAQQQQPPGWGGYPPPPAGQYPPPPPGAGYPPPPGQYAPQGYGQRSDSAGISKAALFTGIGALGSFILAVLLAVVGASGGYSSLRNMLPIIGILSLLALLGGLTAVVLGIITVTQSGKNPAMNKVHGILGICFGAIPIILWLFGMANGSRMRF
jgi:hypothetical protein